MSGPPSVRAASKSPTMRGTVMKALFITAGLLSTLPLAVRADTIEAPSSVARVTVYADGAAVQRRTSVDMPAGESTIVLRGLPAGLDPNSLRVEGQGSAALGIVSVDSRAAPGDARPVVDPDGERRLDALKGERDGLAGAIEAAEGQKAAVLRYAQASPEKLGNEGGTLDPEKWPLAWRTIGAGLAEINETLRGLRDRARLLDDDIAALERARPPAPRPGAPKRDVLVAVSAAGPVKADLSVSYQVSSASWTPVYDARLTTGGEKPKLELVRRASVQQRTGEDWTGVSLALSTVRLRRGTAAPDLPTQVLTLVDPFAEAEAARAAATAARPAPASPTPKMGAEPRSLDIATAQARVAAAPVLATLDAGAYAATFSIPDAVAVPADGTVKSFALGARTVEPTVGARTTPAFDPTGYLEASFNNEDDAPLLPGEVALVRDDAFIGKGRLGLTAPGDKVRLGFGADDRIKVTRVPVARRDNDNGWGPNRSEVQDFRDVVKNLHAFPVRITVLDRVPVSENTAVVVTPLDTNTAPTEKVVDDKRGVSAWTFDTKPGEQKEVRLGWRVRWPADRDLRRQ